MVNYGILRVNLCCTVCARVLHYLCKAAATFLVLLEAAVNREYTYEIRHYTVSIPMM